IPSRPSAACRRCSPPSNVLDRLDPSTDSERRAPSVPERLILLDTSLVSPPPDGSPSSGMTSMTLGAPHGWPSWACYDRSPALTRGSGFSGGCGGRDRLSEASVATSRHHGERKPRRIVALDNVGLAHPLEPAPQPLAGPHLLRRGIRQHHPTTPSARPLRVDQRSRDQCIPAPKFGMRGKPGDHVARPPAPLHGVVAIPIHEPVACVSKPPRQLHWRLTVRRDALERIKRIDMNQDVSSIHASKVRLTFDRRDAA